MRGVGWVRIQKTVNKCSKIQLYFVPSFRTEYCQVFCASEKLSMNFVGLFFAKYTIYHERTFSTPQRNLSSTLGCREVDVGAIEFFVYRPTDFELQEKRGFSKTVKISTFLKKDFKFFRLYRKLQGVLYYWC